MLDCCFGYSFFSGPESSSLLKGTLHVDKWCDGFHLTKTLTYEKMESIRSTRFSDISKISSKGKEWVLKSAKSDEGARGIEQEVSLLKTLNAAEKGKSQKCVIDLIALVKVNDNPAMLIPFFQTDLFDRIIKDNGLSIQSTLNILRQMFKVLAFLKEQKIFHRDIKPENIFIVQGDEIRLADFGLAMRKGDVERSKMSCGTAEYQSPELLKALINNNLQESPFDFPSDMWATAYTVLEVASNRHLFQCDVKVPGWASRMLDQQQKLPRDLKGCMNAIYVAESKEESVAIELFQTALTKMFDLDPRTRLTPEEGIHLSEEKSSLQASSFMCRQS